MRDCDAHHHMLQVDDVVVGVVGAAGRLVHRAHHVLRADGPAAGGKRERGTGWGYHYDSLPQIYLWEKVR